MKKLIFIFLLLFAATINAGQIYVKQESNGDIVYSDVPMTNSKTVNLPQPKPQTVSTEEVVKKTENTEPVIAKDNYKTFRITSPVDQETIQNQPNINVSLVVKPELQKDDRIQLFIDGKRIGEPSSSLQIATGLVERGSHEMYALIVDLNKRSKMQSNVITIYVMRAHTGAPASPPRVVAPAAKKVSSKQVKKPKASLANNR